MSDYTPTTKEVRGAYSMGEPDEIDAFDRWLYKEYAEHVDIGYAIAVAKIIKLLEEIDIKVFGRLVYNDSREELIALIKGEQE